MTTISEKTTIPLKFVISIIALVVGIVFEAGISWNRYNNLEQAFEQHKLEHVSIERQQHEQELKLQRLEIFISNVDRRLESIDKKLERLENR